MAEESATANGPASPATLGSYAPSWVNVLTRWFEDLPGPTWLPYGVGIVAAVALQLVQAPADFLTGDLAPQNAFALVYYAALPFGTLALIHRLDGLASHALAGVRPILRATDLEFAKMHRELTVAPARPAWIITGAAYFVTIAGFIADPSGSGLTGYSAPALVVRTLWEGGISAIFLILIAHTIRQLRLIGSINDRIVGIDLFDQTPLYAMSRLTSTTAIGFIVLLVPSLILFPTAADVSSVVITVAWYSFAVVVAGAAFLLPLRGVHDRLVDGKRDLQSEVGRRLSATLVRIHDSVDANDSAATEAAHQTLATLIAERDLVSRVPTWPWSASALTGFLSAVLLPLILFVIQQGLSRLI